ncbi:MAG: FGGY-family carbohydrate kinase [Planctomycetaceae bacterium]|nr:FGGY-family carbohydrate kinase [Planctomycetaceae bacterium]
MNPEPDAVTPENARLFLGIDIGTSGVRLVLIDQNGDLLLSSSESVPQPELIDGRPCGQPDLWWLAVHQQLQRLTASLQEVGCAAGNIEAIAVDGTSGTMMLVDADLNVVSPALMYNSAGFDEQAIVIARHADPGSIVQGSGSALARMLYLQSVADSRAVALMHQADWIAARLRGALFVSDETNALKTGYDVQSRCWPDWMAACGVRTDLLPQVVPVGDATGGVGAAAQSEYGLSADCVVRAGATDSNAAFLATGAREVGDGVTSLGTTLAIKLLSDHPVVDPARGIYSHRIKEMWLAGGASNVGGATLRQFFNASQILDLQPLMTPEEDTQLNYYPLPAPGERFPVADDSLPPRLSPRPEEDSRFLQGILEGIARVEAEGYSALSDLGAPAVKRVLTAGGGAMNAPWRRIRERYLQVPVLRAGQGEAAMGAARIAAELI